MRPLKAASWCFWFGMLAACGAVQRPDGGTGLLGPGSLTQPLAGRDQHGEVFELAFPSPHVTVVYFYPRDATPGCTKEACAFRDVWNDYERRGIRVVGVSSDDVSSHRSFAESNHLRFPLIADEDGIWARTFGVPQFAGLYSRVTFLVGRDGRIAKVYQDVDPGLHAREILRDAARLAPAESVPPATQAGRQTAPGDALLAPAPQLTTAERPPSVHLTLHAGFAPSSVESRRLWLAAELTPPPGTHLYWKHTGESGLPTRLEFRGPRGFRIGPAQFPGPVRFRTDAGRTGLGYDSPIVVLAEVLQTDPAASLQEGQTFQVHGSWLSCDTRCIQEEGRQSVSWSAKQQPPQLPQWLDALPDSGAQLGFKASMASESQTIWVEPPAAWALEDAFLERDTPFGSNVPSLTRAGSKGRLSGVAPPPPSTILVRALSEGRSKYFTVTVTAE